MSRRDLHKPRQDLTQSHRDLTEVLRSFIFFLFFLCSESFWNRGRGRSHINSTDNSREFRVSLRWPSPSISAICRRRAVARWVRESMRRKSAWVGLLAHEARVTKPRTVGDGESTCDGHRGPESLPDRAWARCHECLPRCGRALCGRHSAFSDARGCRAAQEERYGRRVERLATRRLRVRADSFPAGVRSARRLACPLRCAA